MENPRDRVGNLLRVFLARANKAEAVVTDETSLVAGGLDLDSLELAELSAMLEDEIGRDPFSEGFLPENVGELFAFYDAVPSES